MCVRLNESVLPSQAKKKKKNEQIEKLRQEPSLLHCSNKQAMLK